jgi:hypothetical protein
MAISPSSPARAADGQPRQPTRAVFAAGKPSRRRHVSFLLFLGLVHRARDGTKASQDPPWGRRGQENGPNLISCCPRPFWGWSRHSPAHRPVNPNPQPNGLDSGPEPNIFGAQWWTPRRCVLQHLQPRVVLQDNLHSAFRMGLPRNACDEVPQLDWCWVTVLSVRRMTTASQLDPTSDPNPPSANEYVKGTYSCRPERPHRTFEMNGSRHELVPPPRGRHRPMLRLHASEVTSRCPSRRGARGQSGVFASSFNEEGKEERATTRIRAASSSVWGRSGRIFLSRCPVAGLGASSLGGGNSTGTSASERRGVPRRTPRTIRNEQGGGRLSGAGPLLRAPFLPRLLWLGGRSSRIISTRAPTARDRPVAGHHST